LHQGVIADLANRGVKFPPPLAQVNQIRMNNTSTIPIGLRSQKVIVLSAQDLDRADKFYRETLRLVPAYEGFTKVGYIVDQTILVLKAHLDASQNTAPYPRVCIETEDAPATEKALRTLGVMISDPVQNYDGVHYVGSFLDSERNKLWFSSSIKKKLDRPF
jgi:hypothetical protein